MDTRADGFTVVAQLGDLRENEPLAVTIASGERVCLVRAGGELFAVRDECTHAEFSLSEGSVVDGCALECVWHGARFDLRTGAVLRQPATDPLPTFAVRIEGDAVLVGRRA